MHWEGHYGKSESDVHIHIRRLKKDPCTYGQTTHNQHPVCKIVFKDFTGILDEVDELEIVDEPDGAVMV